MFRFIDVSVSQRGIDFAAMADEIDGPIIKASGANDGLYVAGAYHEHLERARPVWGNVAHYFFNGPAATPPECADYFRNNLDWRPGDAVALDVEDERDRNGVLRVKAYTPDEAYEFAARFKETAGLAPLIYASASVLRSQDWSRCIELGCLAWPAAWGVNDGEPADEWPDLGPQWEGRTVVWQYTSNGTVPGWPSRVDLNLSLRPINQLHDPTGGVDVGYLEARPAKGNMNQGFGPRPKPTPTSPAIHYGQDYGWGGGDAIFAARGGTIKSYGYAGAYGNRLVIDHGRNAAGQSVETWYCHLAAAHKTSGWVDAATHVAEMGATGNVTAKHLHFELRINGVASDPEPYFSTGSTAGGGYTPIEEDDMFTDEDRAKLNSVWSGLYIGGPAVPGGGSIVNLIDGLANRVWWDSTVDRNGDHIPALQELADAKTLALRLEAQVAALTAAVGALAAGSGADPQAIEDAARAGAEEALKGHADGVAAAVREKFRTDPLT